MKKKLRAFFLISFCCTFFYLSLPKELIAIEANLGKNLLFKEKTKKAKVLKLIAVKLNKHLNKKQIHQS